MAHESFAKTVLETLRAESSHRGGEVSSSELSCALHLQTRKDHKRMLNTLSDLNKSGRIYRTRQGVYAIAPGSGTPDKREVMWRTLRMRRVVSIADLQELAGVSQAYAKEWLAMLVAREIVIRIDPADVTKPRSWRLVKNDLPVMPVDEEKAVRLRELRKKKKEQILSTIDSIGNALRKMRDTVATMEEE